MQLSIVIPCYNERQTIEGVVERVRSAPLPAGWERELIIVDDGSNDGTRDLLAGISGRGDVRVILHEQNKGKGGALKTGFQAASGDYLLIQDADNEYHPEDYQILIESVMKNPEGSVFGSRTMGSNNVPVSMVYFYGGQMIGRIFNAVHGTSLTDITTCYKVFPRWVVPQLLRSRRDDFVFDAIDLTHALVQAGPIVEVPIRYTCRDASEGKKLKFSDGLKCFTALVKQAFSLDRLIQWLRFHQVGREARAGAVVADIGCGLESAFLSRIRKQISGGLAIDKRAIPSTRGMIRTIPVDFDHADAERVFAELPAFDQAFMLAVLEHLRHPEAVVRAIYAHLPPGGSLVMTTPSRGSKPVLEFLAFRLHLIDAHEIEDHKHYFSKQELLDLMQRAGFTDIKHRYFELRMNHFISGRKP